MLIWDVERHPQMFQGYSSAVHLPGPRLKDFAFIHDAEAQKEALRRTSLRTDGFRKSCPTAQAKAFLFSQCDP